MSDVSNNQPQLKEYPQVYYKKYGPSEDLFEAIVDFVRAAHIGGAQFKQRIGTRVEASGTVQYVTGLEIIWPIEKQQYLVEASEPFRHIRPQHNHGTGIHTDSCPACAAQTKWGGENDIQRDSVKV